MEIDALNQATMSTTYHPDPIFRNEEERQMGAAVRALNKMEFFGSDAKLVFSRDAETQRPVIRVLDRNTGEKLEQLPPEQFLHIMASIGMDLKGAAKL